MGENKAAVMGLLKCDQVRVLISSRFAHLHLGKGLWDTHLRLCF